jgi:hypothetical protein
VGLNSSVGIPMGYELDGQGSIHGRAKRCFLTSQRPDQLWGPTQPPIQWVPGPLSPGIKRPGREADHSPPSSAEIKNGEAIQPRPRRSSRCDDTFFARNANGITSTSVFSPQDRKLRSVVPRWITRDRGQSLN